MAEHDCKNGCFHADGHMSRNFLSHDSYYSGDGAPLTTGMPCVVRVKRVSWCTHGSGLLARKKKDFCFFYATLNARLGVGTSINNCVAGPSWSGCEDRYGSFGGCHAKFLCIHVNTPLFRALTLLQTTSHKCRSLHGRHSCTRRRQIAEPRALHRRA